MRITKIDILEKGVELNNKHREYNNSADIKEQKKLWTEFLDLNNQYKELFERYIHRHNDIAGLL